jgi:hypothetical protein
LPLVSQVLERLVYDDFTSPEVDPARWRIAEFQDPADSRLLPATDRNARVTTGDGALTVDIRPFSRFHDTVPILNNPKQLYVSTQRFPTPPGARVTFETELAITTEGQIPWHLRDAFGTINLLDFQTGMVLDFAASNDTFFVVYERLVLPNVTTREDYFCHRVVLEVDTAPGQSHHVAISYDAQANHAEWYADGRRVYWADPPVRIEGFNLGMGLFSSREIHKYSRAEREHGQGAVGRWGPWTITTRPSQS